MSSIIWRRKMYLLGEWRVITSSVAQLFCCVSLRIQWIMMCHYGIGRSSCVEQYWNKICIGKGYNEGLLIVKCYINQCQRKDNSSKTKRRNLEMNNAFLLYKLMQQKQLNIMNIKCVSYIFPFILSYKKLRALAGS